MRIPVFARGANPSFDRAILRKSESYAVEQVEQLGRADWVDPGNRKAGIICRELLNFGPKTMVPVVDHSAPANDRALGIKFVPPKNAGQVLGNIHPSILASRENWDWSVEAC